MLPLILALGPLLASPAAPPPAEPGLPPAPAQDAASALTWFEGTWDELLAEAQGSGRLVFVAFLTDPSELCRRLRAETFTDPGVVAEMADVLCFALPTTAEPGRTRAREHQVTVHPTLVWLNADGTEREVIAGFLPPGSFVREARRIARDEDTLGSWRRRVKADPDDLDARLALARKLEAIQRQAGYDAQVAEIRARDPEGTSRASRWLHLRTLREALPTNGYDLDALRAFLSEETDDGLLYEGWYAVWRVEDYLAQLAETDEGRAAHRRAHREAGRRAWAHVPADAVAHFGPELVLSLVDAADELEEAGRAFALTVARRTAGAAPDAALAHHLHSRAAALHGERQEALAAARRSVELEPGNSRWLHHLRTLEDGADGE